MNTMHPRSGARSLGRALLSTLLACSALACSKGAPAPEPRSALPDRFHLASEPPGARAVAEVRARSSEGEEVVVLGIVGGSPDPFVAGAAAFTIVDPARKACHGDGMNCKTPWDYCCEDPKAMQASTAVIELREEGRVIATSARGFHGLSPDKTVVVKGTASRDGAGNLTVVASGIHIRP